MRSRCRGPRISCQSRHSARSVSIQLTSQRFVYGQKTIGHLQAAESLLPVEDRRRDLRVLDSRGDARAAREVVREAAHQAIRDTIFLVELVLRLNSVAEELVRTEGLRYAALFWEMRAISAEAQLETAGGPRSASRDLTARWAPWRGAVAHLIGRLHEAEEVRVHLERRYFEGTPTVFPDLAVDWQALREQAERLAVLGDVVNVTVRRVERGRRRRPQIDLCQVRAAALRRAPEEAASLVDAARAAALDALGDTLAATKIAERRLRANAAPSRTQA
jgi:hypothetical protein